MQIHRMLGGQQIAPMVSVAITKLLPCPVFIECTSLYRYSLLFSFWHCYENMYICSVIWWGIQMPPFLIPTARYASASPPPPSPCCQPYCVCVCVNATYTYRCCSVLFGMLFCHLILKPTIPLGPNGLWRLRLRRVIQQRQYENILVCSY